jgi:ubiquinone/menaquinone biosynthesis C-methylase UbiE
MNYGYAEAGPGAEPLRLEPRDEAERYPIQLYQHAVEPVELRGRAVLEVGCGRGGGASYLARRHAPGSVLGVDFSPKAIELCRRLHQAPGLAFEQGDAEALPCADAAFDTVVNVESSHCYPSPAAFFREAFRVLRPGGHFLWVDMRAAGAVDDVRTQLGDAGFESVRDLDITPNVLRALDLMSESRAAMIRRLVPAPLAGAVGDFAGVRGTRVYEALRSGEVVYMSCALRKPGS